MGSVVSATTGRAYGDMGAPRKFDSFIFSAEALLAQAHTDFAARRYDLAMENAYRAALRIAGACNARSIVLRKRKRLPTNAWDKLALTGESGQHWATVFSAYSARRARVASGIDDSPSPVVVSSLIGSAEDFLLDTTGGDAPMAA
ncbi:SAV_6107 family HEPN domain-containing protein [Corynebacterium coyleae]|uniref:SAV_6107 family HEPN domain-containing protein n=1 Tax=Corynebacterium coyleae TaxID=53374 RepID=UPI00254B7423|nr:SAV_6107 family HEPN domain-containing protein [Corynebacterium coyleae]MDK8822314.1 SAV_6107 family HEPN domain-containing protein [Corynebacterium coyleae]